MMFECQGWWLPDGEEHLVGMLVEQGHPHVQGRAQYQLKKLLESRCLARQRRVAVDVGAHVGLWAWPMAHMFQTVHAFEPMSNVRECFERNVPARNVIMHPVALGARPGRVEMQTAPGSSGDTHVVPAGGGVAVLPLDAFNLVDVDYIKIDCEGYEHEVVEGARKTLERCRPAICVEQKPQHQGRYTDEPRPAVRLLEEMGARVRGELYGDYYLSWDDE